MSRVSTVLAESLMVTGFVFVMMILVEYAQVVTAGLFGRWLQRGGVFRTGAVALVATLPGCLGAFTDVTLYIHRMISFGALTGAMIASSGDAAFVMLALFPKQALLLFLLLFLYGLAVAAVVERVRPSRFYRCDPCPEGIELHLDERGVRWETLRRASFGECSFPRATLCTTLALFLLAVVAGWIGPSAWNWVRITVLLVAAIAFGVVFVAPEHFLQEHLYAHVAKKHLPKIFLWVVGILLGLAWLKATDLPMEAWIERHGAWALVAAVAVGLIPESGPHLVFVTLFAQGALPFSALAASSVVQDGHGMLPLLAESRWEFVKVKAVNAVAGLLLGGALMALGW
jgi:Putative, 10TM heavy-metal exporter